MPAVTTKPPARPRLTPGTVIFIVFVLLCLYTVEHALTHVDQSLKAEVTQLHRSPFATRTQQELPEQVEAQAERELRALPAPECPGRQVPVDGVGGWECEGKR